jgi:hypothetical protein
MYPEHVSSFGAVLGGRRHHDPHNRSVEPYTDLELKRLIDAESWLTKMNVTGPHLEGRSLRRRCTN